MDIIQAGATTLSDLTQLFQLLHLLQRAPAGVNKVTIFMRDLNRHEVKVRPNICSRESETTRGSNQTNIHP